MGDNKKAEHWIKDVASSWKPLDFPAPREIPMDLIFISKGGGGE